MAIADGALPCPSCEYDLRAQAIPRCPECGQEFQLLDDLAAAVSAAQRVYKRAQLWRNRVAVGLLMSLGLAGMAAVPGLRVFGWFPYLLIPLASGAAFVLLVQVARWRFDARISPARRRELNGSFPVCSLSRSHSCSPCSFA